ncbi:MAG: hypothetical protein IPP47_22960 [Bryobacterales bacterium]|nr:hypothetical protein [Bryobacterales bacterium]
MICPASPDTRMLNPMEDAKVRAARGHFRRDLIIASAVLRWNDIQLVLCCLVASLAIRCLERN